MRGRPSWTRAARAAVAAVGAALCLRADPPVREHHFIQSGANVVQDGKAAVTMRVYSTALLGSEAELELQRGSSRTVMPMVATGFAPRLGLFRPTTQQNEEAYAFRLEYPNAAAMYEALPNGDYSASLTQAIRAVTFPVTLAGLPPGVPRITNFDALQTWNGGAVQIQWDGSATMAYFGLFLPNGQPALELFPVIYYDPYRVSPYPGYNPGPTFWSYAIPLPMTRGLSIPADLMPRAEALHAELHLLGRVGDTDIRLVLEFPLRRVPLAPTIVTAPAEQRVLVGAPVTFTIVAGGAGLSYQWRLGGADIPGATAATLRIPSAQFADTGDYSVVVTNTTGSVRSSDARLTVAAAAAAPSIATQPAPAAVLHGGKAVLSVSAAGSDLTYQWRRDGVPLAGATAASFTLENARWSDAGNYTVAIANTAGTVTSEGAQLTVNPVARIGNVSLLTTVSQPGDSFTLGYVIGGGSGEAKPLVIRAAGPSLGALGVPDTLATPKLELYAGAAKTTENARWGGDTRLRDAMAAVGAFAFASPESSDAAALASVTGRDNSVKVSGANGGTGMVIAEIYDATPDPLFTVNTPRLLNVSVLKPIGSGLTLGFVISGASPKTVLIRAIGPTLGAEPFGVPDVVADPQLTLFTSSQSAIAQNNDWGGTAALSAAFASVGAFNLPATSRDAALIATLAPGNYTVEVKGAGASTGTALVEVYELSDR